MTQRKPLAPHSVRASGRQDLVVEADPACCTGGAGSDHRNCGWRISSVRGGRVHTRRRTTYQNLLRWYPPVWDKNFAMILDKGRLTRMQSVIESMPDESVQFSPRRRQFSAQHIQSRSTPKEYPDLSNFSAGRRRISACLVARHQGEGVHEMRRYRGDRRREVVRRVGVLHRHDADCAFVKLRGSCLIGWSDACRSRSRARISAARVARGRRCLFR